MMPNATPNTAERPPQGSGLADRVDRLVAAGMRRAAPITRLAERQSGVPARFVVPVLVASASLLIAVLGMYWDIGYHIDHGRDQNLFTLPHDLIVIGLQGIVVAALLHGIMPGPRGRGEREQQRVPDHAELGHAEVELGLEGRQADQEGADERGVAEPREERAARRQLALRALALDVQDPRAEDRERRAADEQ